MFTTKRDDTICALSTASGVAAIGVIRISGKETFPISEKLFSKKLSDKKSHTVHFGTIKKDGRVVDEVVITIFKGPNSFTGEDTVEISCHGSPYIEEQILQACLDNGCRMAEPGEFTMRGFMNGKMDLSQAEAVADLISSSSKASHQLAMHQMRGGFSKDISALREKLIHFASMIELELDFSEEDVEFADRGDLKELVDEIRKVLRKLVDSFATGNVLKNGVPVTIVGAPNMGKSTLLNALLNDNRAIVSEIAGTTRDVIEDEMSIGGVGFRFIDTAGIRETSDTIETMGIEKTFEKVNQASIVLYMVDTVDSTRKEIIEVIEKFREKIDDKDKQLVIVANKIDKAGDTENVEKKFTGIENVIFLSALTRSNLDHLENKLLETVNTGVLNREESIVTNARHYEALSKALSSLDDVRTGLDNNITGDFLAIDIRKSLHHLGEITGEITTDDLLGNIFSKFCIGK
jgi:tRNA modification GTPase